MDPATWIPAIFGIIIAVGGAWWVNRASGAKSVTDATKALLDPLTTRIENLEIELRAANQRIQELEDLVALNHAQLETAREQLEREKRERSKDRKRLTRVEKWARALHDQVISLGGTPIRFEDIDP